MGWSVGYDSTWKRDIGYGVPSVCDYPGCEEPIDRGLSYVCGGEPFGGDDGCGLYFCGKHLSVAGPRYKPVCARCEHGGEPFDPKPDTPAWRRHKLKHPSWAAWRKEHPREAAALAGPTAPPADSAPLQSGAEPR